MRLLTQQSTHLIRGVQFGTGKSERLSSEDQLQRSCSFDLHRWSYQHEILCTRYNQLHVDASFTRDFHNHVRDDRGHKAWLLHTHFIWTDRQLRNGIISRVVGVSGTLESGARILDGDRCASDDRVIRSVIVPKIVPKCLCL